MTPSEQYPRPVAEDLDHRFQHHPPRSDQAARYAAVRQAVRDCAGTIVSLSPGCREQERALEALDAAMMLANAAIARHERWS